MINTIWPWSRIRELESELLVANCYVREACIEADLAQAEIRHLHRVLDTGHFRDPKTGRIGKKGVRP